MKKKVIIVAVIALLCSCNRISNKPIYEELTINEVGKAMKQDSSFGWFYDDVVEANYALKMSPSEKARFKKVSYRKYFAYTKYKYDFLKWMKKDSIWGEEWAQKYVKEIAATDSVINYWKQYKQDCYAEVNKYIKGKITNVGIESDYEYNWDTRRNEWKPRRSYEITYTLLVPKVDKVEISIVWRDKYGESDGWHGSSYDENITQNDTVKKHVCGGLNDEKPSEVWITSVEINGQTISSKYDKYDVPQSVREYIENEKEYDWNKVGREFAGENFVSKDSYLSQKREEDLRAFDNLCYEFDQEF